MICRSSSSRYSLVLLYCDKYFFNLFYVNVYNGDFFIFSKKVNLYVDLSVILDILQHSDRLYSPIYRTKEYQQIDETSSEEEIYDLDVIDEIKLLWFDSEFLKEFYKTREDDYLEKYPGRGFSPAKIATSRHREAKKLLKEISDYSSYSDDVVKWRSLFDAFYPSEEKIIDEQKVFFNGQRIKISSDEYPSDLRIYALYYDDIIVVCSCAIKLTHNMPRKYFDNVFKRFEEVESYIENEWT